MITVLILKDSFRSSQSYLESADHSQTCKKQFTVKSNMENHGINLCFVISVLFNINICNFEPAAPAQPVELSLVVNLLHVARPGIQIS